MQTRPWQGRADPWDAMASKGRGQAPSLAGINTAFLSTLDLFPFNHTSAKDSLCSQRFIGSDPSLISTSDAQAARKVLGY